MSNKEKSTWSADDQNTDNSLGAARANNFVLTAYEASRSELWDQFALSTTQKGTFSMWTSAAASEQRPIHLHGDLTVIDRRE
jgi:hypothetical protein